MIDIRVYMFADNVNNLHLIPGDKDFGIKNISLCGIKKNKLKSNDSIDEPHF